MREYTAKERKLLLANPYTYKVTKNKLYFTVAFKEDFWTGYQAGVAPRKMLSELGYDPSMFGKKQIDSIVQNIKQQALSGEGFKQGENRTRRTKDPMKLIEKELAGKQIAEIEGTKALERLLAEVKYLRQEVEFLKKIARAENTRERRRP
ncbi:MAG: hypothetical protein K6G50_11650 [bacterium]|nr:hypothetical protein [bacterium]